MEIRGKHILVVGLGYRTGLSSCNFLAGRGAVVTASDVKRTDELAGVTAKLDPSVRVLAGAQDPSILDGRFDMIVLSPGVPASIPLIVEAKRRGISVISEIELAYRFCRGSVIAITGTDGKSTTTALTGHIFSALGFKTLVGGNIGIPLVSLVDETNDDTVSVVELSSFQLETVERFRPDAAAILNVTPDHLDRYAGMDDYFRAKMRIAMNQTPADAFVYGSDDAYLSKAPIDTAAGRLRFSYADRDADAYLDGGGIHARFEGAPVRCLDVSKLRIMGRHNALNAMAAILLTVSVLGKRSIRPDCTAIADACCSFPGLRHRMERVGELAGRLFINDSKATTVGAVMMALESVPGGVTLILGGRTKGDDYSRLADSMRGRVKNLILIGESATAFEKLFAGFNIARAESLDDAVVEAMRKSLPGDTVLLSPACASFDMFTSYEERGDRFVESYLKLVRGELEWI